MEQFEKSEFFGLEPKELIEALETNATTITEGHAYAKPLSEGEKNERSSEMNQLIYEIETIKDERKALTAKIAEFQKAVLEHNKVIIRGYHEVAERVYTVNNHNTGFAEKINNQGYIVERFRFKEGQEMSLFERRNDEDIEQAI